MNPAADPGEHLHMFRKTLFWLHLVAGCVAGAIILLMSFTGVLLMYERQLLAWFERGALEVEATAGTPRLPVNALLAAVEKERGALPPNAVLTLRSHASEPAEIRAGREAAVYVNPYTGKVLGAGGGAGAAAAFQKLRAWHRWLGMEGAGRATGKAITGASNLLFLFIVMSGAYLWLPRRWAWQNVRPILLFRSEKTGKARDFNWHNVFGVWALIPLFFVVLGALPISYTWASNLVYRITGSEPPAPPPAAAAQSGKREQRTSTEPAPTIDVNLLWSRAQAQVAGWRSISAPAAPASKGPVSFTIDTGDGGQPQKRSTLLLKADSGDVAKWERFEDASAGRQLRMWTRFVHTGEYYGLVGQTIAGLASFAGVMLVWTGISLALRRFSAWRTRQQRRLEVAA